MRSAVVIIVCSVDVESVISGFTVVMACSSTVALLVVSA